VDVQARFVSGAIDILVATLASFGTGVDMPRVCKFVIYGVPASVHTLMQLVGGGGRAGQPYSTDVFASRADMTKQHMILKNETSKLPAGTHSHYAQHLADSFALVQRLLLVAQGQDTCCLHTLLVLQRSLARAARALRAACAGQGHQQTRGGGRRSQVEPSREALGAPAARAVNPVRSLAQRAPGRGRDACRAAALHALLELQIPQTPPSCSPRGGGGGGCGGGGGGCGGRGGCQGGGGVRTDRTRAINVFIPGVWQLVAFVRWE